MKDFSKTQLFCLLQEYLEKGNDLDLNSILELLENFLDELRDYICSKKDFETLSRSLYLASIVFDSLKDYYHAELDSPIGICIRNVQLCLQKEIQLMNEKALHPEWFITEPKNYVSPLQFIPEPPDLGLIFLAEIVVGLSKTKRIQTVFAKPSPLIEVSEIFELMFNFRFGNIYDLQDQIYRRKPYNRTKGLDYLKQVILRDEK